MKSKLETPNFERESNNIPDIYKLSKSFTKANYCRMVPCDCTNLKI